MATFLLPTQLDAYGTTLVLLLFAAVPTRSAVGERDGGRFFPERFTFYLRFSPAATSSSDASSLLRTLHLYILNVMPSTGRNI